jgi:DNA-binding beta-propeller fold protein YncE
VTARRAVAVAVALAALAGACSGGDDDPQTGASSSTTAAPADGATVTVELAGRPADVAYADGVLWVVEDETGKVQRLDAATGAPLGEAVAVSGAPASVAVGSGSVLFADAFGVLLRMDAATASLVPPPIPIGRSFVDIVIDGDAVWVVDIGLGTVSRLDRTGSVAWTTQVPSGAVRVVLAGGRLWVSGIEDTVAALDPGTGKLIGDPVQVGTGPIGMAASAGRLWVANSDDDTVSRLDPATGASLGAPVEVGRAPIAVAVDGDAVWVLDQDDAAVARLDASSGRRLGPDLALPMRPRSFVVTPAGLWVVGVDPPTAVLVPR